MSYSCDSDFLAHKAHARDLAILYRLERRIAQHALETVSSGHATVSTFGAPWSLLNVKRVKLRILCNTRHSLIHLDRKFYGLSSLELKKQTSVMFQATTQTLVHGSIYLDQHRRKLQHETMP